MEKFPEKVYSCFDRNGKAYFFTDLEQCPTYYDGKVGIRIAIYTINEYGLLKQDIPYIEEQDGK